VAFEGNILYEISQYSYGVYHILTTHQIVDVNLIGQMLLL